MVDVDRFFHRTVLKPADPQRWELTDAEALKTSDVLTYVVPASEVSAELIAQTFVNSPNLYVILTRILSLDAIEHVWSERYEDLFGA